MRLSFYAGNIYKGKLYFSSCYYNALFEKDLKTGEIHTISYLEKEEGCPVLYRNSFRCGNDIWFIPGNAKHILKYNVENRNVDYIEFLNICQHDPSDTTGLFFHSVLRDGDSLLLLPYAVDSVIKIDMKSGDIYVAKDIHLQDGKKVFCGEVVNGRLLIFLTDFKSYIDIDLDGEDKWELREWNTSIDGESHRRTVRVGDEIWFAPRNKDYFTIWNAKNDSLEKVSISGEKNNSYSGGIVQGDEVIFFPFYSDHFLIVNKNTHNVRTLRKNEYGYIFANGENIMNSIESDEGTYITAGGMGAYIKYDGSFDDYEAFTLDTENNDVYATVQTAMKSDKLFELLHGKDTILQEKEIGLENFLRRI